MYTIKFVEIYKKSGGQYKILPKLYIVEIIVYKNQSN